MSTSETQDALSRLLSAKPYLQAYFAFEAGDAPTFRLEETRDDSHVPTLLLGDRRQRLASAYNPGQEAERTLPAGRESWKGTEIVLILGLGNPYVPRGSRRCR